MRRISTGSPFEETMAYSRAVVRGNWCFVSGATGYDYGTMTMPQAPLEQAHNCFKTIFMVLEQAEFSRTDIVRVQYTVRDAACVEQIAPALREALGDVRPAATMVIAGLIRPEMKVEVEVTAMKE